MIADKATSKEYELPCWRAPCAADAAPDGQTPTASMPTHAGALPAEYKEPSCEQQI